MGDGKKNGAKTPFAIKALRFSLLVTAFVFLPSTIIFVVCMIPSFVAALVDSHPQKTAWLTVGATNLAGTLPAIMALWGLGHTLDAALDVVSRPQVLLTAYGGAAVGWALYNGVTPFVGGIVVARNERRVREIERRQKELVRKWGEDVAK